MNDTSGGAGRASPLARAARELAQQARQGILCSLIPEDGYPYGSLVEVLPLDNGDMILFLSRLAEHRRFLDANSRAALVIAPHIHDERAMAQPRVALIGRCEPVEDRAQHAAAFAQYHPTAASYIDFPDFQFYRFQVERARYIAGFGQMGWIKGETYAAANP